MLNRRVVAPRIPALILAVILAAFTLPVTAPQGAGAALPCGNLGGLAARVADDTSGSGAAAAAGVAGLSAELTTETTVDGGADGPIEVLVFSRTRGFRHQSIADAKQLFESLDAGAGIAPTLTEDPSMFTDTTLARFDVVAFVNTTGDVLDDDQQAAMERFVAAGGGYVGVHSAADTEYEWPWYEELLGTLFRTHPLLPVHSEVTTEDPGHPATDHLPEKFWVNEEIYDFTVNPRGSASVLLTIDERTGVWLPGLDGSFLHMGDDHPIAWHKEFDGGRSFYTNLGHSPETWSKDWFREHVLEGIRWAAETAAWNAIAAADGLRFPVALEVADSGVVFVNELTGAIKAWDPNTANTHDVGRLDVAMSGEGGLLGIELAPDAATSGGVFLYWSDPALPTPEGIDYMNVLSRFTLDAECRLDPASRADILRVPSGPGNHEGGDLDFMPDGTLLISTGDDTFASNYAPLDGRPGEENNDSRRTAGNPHDLRGKILRINPDGSIPPGNMHPADGTQGRPEVYLSGTRNPFRIAVDESSGRVFWGDVGPDAYSGGPPGPRGYDEFNVADAPGDYGWPFCIGDNKPYRSFDAETGRYGEHYDCSGLVPAAMSYDYLTNSEPVFGTALSWGTFTGRTAIAGSFYDPAPGAPYALPFGGTLLAADFTRGVLAALAFDAAGRLTGVRSVAPWIDFTSPIDVAAAPDGAVYVIDFELGRLVRLEHASAGLPSPVAVADVSPTDGESPLTVALDGSKSSSRGDTVVGWEWDVDADGVTDTTGETTAFTFTTPGRYRVGLTVVTATNRRSRPASVDVTVGNRRPVVTITEGPPGGMVEPGGTVTMRARADDPDAGPLACDAISWRVGLGHHEHVHPVSERGGCDLTFEADTLGHGLGAGVWFSVEARAVDAGSGAAPPLEGVASERIELAIGDGDLFSFSTTGGRQYAIEGVLSSGNLHVRRDRIGIVSVRGRGILPSASGTGTAMVSITSQRIFSLPWHIGLITISDRGAEFEGFGVIPLTNPTSGDGVTVFGDSLGLAGLGDVRGDGFIAQWSVTDRQ